VLGGNIVNPPQMDGHVPKKILEYPEEGATCRREGVRTGLAPIIFKERKRKKKKRHERLPGASKRSGGRKKLKFWETTPPRGIDVGGKRCLNRALEEKISGQRALEPRRTYRRERGGWKRTSL